MTTYEGDFFMSEQDSKGYTYPNYELKAQVLRSPEGQEYIYLDRYLRRQEFLHFVVRDSDDNETPFPSLDLQTILDTRESLSDDVYFREAVKINRAAHARAKRLRGKIEALISTGRAIFLTLTFTDDVLSSTSADTRHAYVKRFLKQESDWYVGNIDFGAQNGREHYHAVVLPKDDNVDVNSWHKYGAIKAKRVLVSDLAPLRLSKYVAKLGNHAVKETCRQSRLMYSRSSDTISLRLDSQESPARTQ